MAYIVSDGDADVIHASTHGMMSRADLEFFRDRIDKVSRAAGNFASRYLGRAKDALDNFDFSSIRDRVEGMRSRFGKRWDEDRILPLVDLGDFQNAKPKMRAIVMSNPRYRALWYKGQADGYDGLYEDDERDSIGREHDMYREIYNGSHVEGEEGEDTFVTYLGVVDEYGDAKFNISEKDDARDTHRTLEEILNRGKQDPGSLVRKTL
ncbi:hypothetical protein D3C85_149360 [compost metagenome]